MKHSTLLPAAAVIFFAFSANPHKSSKTFTLPGNYTAAVQVTESDYSSLTSQYAMAHGSETLGGRIGKSTLNTLIENMAESKPYVHLRFCTDEAGRTSLMFAGDKGFLSGSVDYCRNGGSDDAFCPTNCDAETPANVTVSLSKNEFTTLSDAFQQAHPTATLGGNIDKTALLAVINSLGEGHNTVAFRFCTDAETGNTSIIFIGGTVGTNDGNRVMVRNGGSAESFCPTHCEL